MANANGFLRNKSASSHLRFATGEQVYTGYTARFEKGIIPPTLKLMNTHELFCGPMSISTHERLYIMTDVQQNHLTDDPNDMSALFSAADVAIIRPNTGYIGRRKALNQSRTLLRSMTGCVHTIRTKKGERFIHDKNPVRDGLDICHGCIFHQGNKRGMIPLSCPDNIAARKQAAEENPSLAGIADTDLRQLSFR